MPFMKTMASSTNNQIFTQILKILQICHHLSWIGPPGAEIRLPGSFLKIKGDLLDLFRPTNPTDDIRFRLLPITRCFFGQPSVVLFSLIFFLAFSIGSTECNPWEVRTAVQRATLTLKQKHKKVQPSSLRLFHQIVNLATKRDYQVLKNLLDSLVIPNTSNKPTSGYPIPPSTTKSQQDFQTPRKMRKPTPPDPKRRPSMTHTQRDTLYKGPNTPCQISTLVILGLTTFGLDHLNRHISTPGPITWETNHQLMPYYRPQLEVWQRTLGHR